MQALAQQPDGRIYVAGFFDLINGVPCGGLARLGPHGDLDASFVPPPSLNVNTVALQADGKVLANLGFSGVPSRVVRLHADGSVDSSFRPYTNHATSLIVAQPDGGVLVATWQPGQHLIRLGPDGNVDSSFSAAVDNVVNAVVALPSGQLLIGGGFTTVDGVARGGLARLNGDGSLDTTFAPVANPDAWVNCIALAPDDRIVMAGGFGRRDGSPRRAIARLQPDGRLDPTFDPGDGIGPGDVEIKALAVQADGRVLIGGNFGQVKGVPRGGFARLNADGSLDTGFIDTHLSSDDDIEVRAIMIHSTNGALVGGDDPIGLVRVELGATGTAPTIQGPPLSQTRFVGQSVTFEIGADGTPPLHHQWRIDGVPLGAATNMTLAIADLTPADAGRYSVLVSNAVGTATSTEAILTVLPRRPGADLVDPSFDPTWGGALVGAADGRASVEAFALLPDGKTIIAGNFSAFNGTPRNRIARLNSNYTLDDTFSPRGIDGMMQAVALQTDGRLLIGGTFTTVDGRSRSGLARLNPDGTLDVDFRAEVLGPNVGLLGVEASGKIWVGGNFSTIAGVACRNLARLKPDGTVDTAFAPPGIVSGPYDYVRWVQSLPDGRVLVGGHFENRRAQGLPDQNLVRLYPDGGLDTTFDSDLSGLYLATAVVRPDTTMVVGGMLHSWTGGSHYFALAELEPSGRVVHEFSTRDLPAMVTSILLQPDARLIIGGMFETLFGVPRNGVGRLNADATLDSTFDPGEVFAPPLEPSILALALQRDGRLWVGAEHAGQSEATHALALLQPDGQPVRGFQPRLLGTGGVVTALAQEPAGGLLVGGSFTSFNNQPRTHLARLKPDGSLDPDFLPTINANLAVRILLRQPDGRLLVAGRVDPSAAGPPASGVVRLNPNGSTDATFGVSPNGDGECGYVRCAALQSDGRIVIGGEFNLPPRGLARLNTDGSVDPSFVPPNLPAWDEEGVHAVAVLANGRILIGGELAGVPNGLDPLLARLHPDGSVDRSYTLGVVLHGSVKAIVAAPDGKWLVGGVWADAGGTYDAGLLRLNARGELDAVIEVGQAINPWPLAAQTDGDILTGGSGIVRFTSEGFIDRTFAVRLARGGVINALLIQPDGRILIGGDFSSINGLPANNLVRLYPDPPPRAPFVERHVGPQTQVRLVVQPPAGTRRYSVEDQPSGQPVAAVSSGGRYDPTTGKVTFGPFGDEQPRELTYQVVSAPGAAGQIRFQGSATANGLTTSIVGDDWLRIWPFPPPPLWLEMRRRPLSQRLVLQVWSPRDGSLEIEASADLRGWDTLATLTSLTGFMEFVDPSPASASRFYRVRHK